MRKPLAVPLATRRPRRERRRKSQEHRRQDECEATELNMTLDSRMRPNSSPGRGRDVKRLSARYPLPACARTGGHAPVVPMRLHHGDEGRPPPRSRCPVRLPALLGLDGRAALLRATCSTSVLSSPTLRGAPNSEHSVPSRVVTARAEQRLTHLSPASRGAQDGAGRPTAVRAIDVSQVAFAVLIESRLERNRMAPRSHTSLPTTIPATAGGLR